MIATNINAESETDTTPEKEFVYNAKRRGSFSFEEAGGIVDRHFDTSEEEHKAWLAKLYDEQPVLVHYFNEQTKERQYELCRFLVTEVIASLSAICGKKYCYVRKVQVNDMLKARIQVEEALASRRKCWCECQEPALMTVLADTVDEFLPIEEEFEYPRTAEEQVVIDAHIRAVTVGGLALMIAVQDSVVEQRRAKNDNKAKKKVQAVK